MAVSSRRIDTGNAVATTGFWLDASVGPHGEIAFTGSEAGHPAELYFLKSPDAKAQRITSFNDKIAGLELGRVETIHWKNDGLDCDGVVTYPPDFAAGKKYPLVLYIHGGPWSMYTVGFNWDWQNFAANGYAVLFTNPRGSTGYGMAFQKMNFQDELRALLRKHEIEWDEKYVWD